MKKVLILTYDFPPYVSVGGLRPYMWYKYMHEFDVYPIVITRQWSNRYGNHLDYIAASETNEIISEVTPQGIIIKTPYRPNLANKIMLKYGDSKYRLVRRFISAYYELTQFVFFIGPKVSLYFAAKEYLKKNQVDLIIATGDPFILFKYASKLSKAFNTPWIADYRDPWSQKNSIPKNLLLNKWYSYCEKKIVKTSSIITTVSTFLEVKISSLIKNKPFSIIPNGYDPEVVESLKEEQGKIFSIAFAGSIYNWHPIKSFLSEVSNFTRDNKNISFNINFYGINIASELKNIISDDFPTIKEHINIYPKISNDLLLKELAKNNIMLLFNDYSIMGTKIYDYIGIKRAILFCYSNDKEAYKLKMQHYRVKKIEGISNHLQEDLIRLTNSGYVIKDAQQLQTVLKQLYDEFNTKGYIECNTINAENYSRKSQVKELAEIIKNKF
jgi:glycosyltransferase involved in cell wall biosynthesis